MARRTRLPAKAASHAGDILALSPLVIGSRLAEMSLATPFGFAMSMRALVVEKSFAVAESGTAVWFEMTRQTIESSLGRAALPRHAAEDLAEAALRPVARRVRANAAAKRKKIA
jgi:hypothetical protein